MSLIADTGISNCDFGQLLAHQGIGLIDPLSLPQVDPFHIPLHPVAKVQL